jgi:hypothetical protein
MSQFGRLSKGETMKALLFTILAATILVALSFAIACIEQPAPVTGPEIDLQDSLTEVPDLELRKKKPCKIGHLRKEAKAACGEVYTLIRRTCRFRCVPPPPHFDHGPR